MTNSAKTVLLFIGVILFIVTINLAAKQASSKKAVGEKQNHISQLSQQTSLNGLLGSSQSSDLLLTKSPQDASSSDVVTNSTNTPTNTSLENQTTMKNTVTNVGSKNTSSATGQVPTPAINVKASNIDTSVSAQSNQELNPKDLVVHLPQN